MIQAVLLDLDGTFADTAPDLAYALNHMRESRGLPPLPLSATRPVTSLGARGLLNAGFGMAPDHPDYGAMRQEFLRLYEENICRETRLFAGMPEFLKALEARKLSWGIVTNKAEYLAKKLLSEMGLAQRASCIIGGDTTARFKPFPDPLFAACKAIRREASECIYVGDDKRDIEAAHAAGMKAVAVRWGYLNGGDPERWDAEWIVSEPGELLACLGA